MPRCLVENWRSEGNVTRDVNQPRNFECSNRIEPKVYKLRGVYWVFFLDFILVREHLTLDGQTLS
jgi:hypothetical protein